jgi:hypothetical protein
MRTGPGRKRLSSSLMPSRPLDDTQRPALPIRGQALRHSYSTAVDLKTDDLIRHFLIGHAPKGISQDYVALLILPGDARGAGADF